MTTQLFSSRFSWQRFFEEYWQRKPLFIKNAIDLSQISLNKDKLIQLACEEDIESRIVKHKVDSSSWQVEHGPFDVDDTFWQQENSPWTLLVQSIEILDDDFSQLLKQIPIPRWRIDDIMVSYASDGGGVGPHIDQYDVFLIQGSGKRHWRVGDKSQQLKEIFVDDALKQVSSFEATIDVITEPGDLLYIPPNVAHHGTAIDSCMTFSVGFRAPNLQELLPHYTENLLASLEKSARYTDAQGVPFNDVLHVDESSFAKFATDFQSILWDALALKEAFLAQVTQQRNDFLFEDEELDSPVNPTTISELNLCEAMIGKHDRIASLRHENQMLIGINGEVFSSSMTFYNWLTKLYNTPETWVPISLDDDADKTLLWSLYESELVQIQTF
ncbi:MAG: cupin domain-containing protein [Pseudomonadota bacterium]